MEIIEAKSNKNLAQIIPHNELLENLLKEVEEQDFYESGKIPKGQKLKQKHYLICSMKYLLDLAKAKDWGMRRYAETIYLYNGQYWNLIGKDEISYFLSEAAEKMGIDKYDAKHYAFARKLYDQFLFSANFKEPEIIKNKVLINLQNGTFEINKDGFQLREFRASDFLTYQLNFNYLPSADCPKFKKYLDKVLPDISCQFILSEYLGYVFTKHLKLEKCLLLYGSGANGKSVFFEIVNAMLGERNISNCDLASLESEYHRATLANKLLNYSSEIKGNINANIFKQLSSGEAIPARLPYGRPFTLKHYAKLIFNCNELPKNVEHNEAYFRRFLIIPFSVTIPKLERNPNLANEIISEELDGVFNWMLKGLERLLKNGRFTESEKVNTLMESYRKESDSVKLFLEEENWKVSSSSSKSLKLIYGEYRIYCISSGYTALNKKNFRRRLESLNIMVGRHSQGIIVYLEKNKV